MKKLIAIIAAATISAAAFAQVPQGVRGGFGISLTPYQYSASGEIEPSMLTGVNFFGGYEYKLDKISAVSADLRFTLVGILDKHVKSSVAGSRENKYRRAYLEIPVKYVAHFGSLYVNAGPTFSFAVSNKVREIIGDLNGNIVSDTTTNLFDDRFSTKWNKFNVALGAEIGFDFSDIRLFAGYDYYLLPTAKQEVLGKTETAKISQIRFGCAYIF